MEYCVLVENHEEVRDIKAEHGLSIFFSKGGKKILSTPGRAASF